MVGYRNLPVETANAFTATGYLRTGDIGIIDERGFIKIVDRKDMIVVSGFNVYPNEIESVMLEHADVLEVRGNWRTKRDARWNPKYSWSENTTASPLSNYWRLVNST